MDVKRLINLILLILILYFLIYNFRNFHYSFSLPSYILNNDIQNHSLQFLTSRESNILGIDKPLEHFSPNEMRKSTTQLDKCAPSVKAGNYYTDDTNTANFGSNVMNVPKFFKRTNYNSDGVPETPKSAEEPFASQSCSDGINHETGKCFSHPDSGTTTFTADQWSYKNELPMNGGFILPDLTGYNADTSAFATYDTTPATIGDKWDCNKQPDDIRMGMGDPNKEYRATR